VTNQAARARARVKSRVLTHDHRTRRDEEMSSFVGDFGDAWEARNKIRLENSNFEIILPGASSNAITKSKSPESSGLTNDISRASAPLLVPNYQEEYVLINRLTELSGD